MQEYVSFWELIFAFASSPFGIWIPALLIGIPLVLIVDNWTNRE